MHCTIYITLQCVLCVNVTFIVCFLLCISILYVIVYIEKSALKKEKRLLRLGPHVIDVLSDVLLKATERRYCHLTKKQWVEVGARSERGFL